MQAIVQDRYGSADVLELRDVPDPAVGEQDVLISVHAAGCGPDVWHVMTGRPYMARPILGLRRPKIAIRGSDVAGTVAAVGTAVTGFQRGEQVMGIAEGSFAQRAVIRGGTIVHKPSCLTFEQAAAVPVSGLTALQAVRDKGKVQPGQAVLVIGAAGGVGTFTVQIAKSSGAVVTGVCSGSKGDLVRSIGADDVIDYTREDFTAGARRWDVIIDTAGRRSLASLRRALTPRGRLVVVGGDGGGNWTGGFFRGILRGPLLSMFTRQTLIGFVSSENSADLQTLAELIESGAVTPVVDRIFPLADAAAAVEYLAQGHPGGKVILTV